ncbi:MAG: TRAP transporter large permease [Desulfitobacteriia bacterium]|jgi:tripartite ATP-independent transporter DctM subunit
MDIALALIVTFLLAMVIGIPISFSLGISSLVALLIWGQVNALDVIVARTFRGMDSYPLMAIPLFMLAGELMGISITNKLINLAQALIGFVRGGLSLVTVLTAMFFGGITGVGVAENVALGSILVPAMKEKGYKPEFAAALIGASSTMGPIIPPSVPMVIYCLAVGGSVSVAGLFLSGIVPGIMLGLSFMAVAIIVMKVKKYPMDSIKFSFKNILTSLREAIWALGMPLIIVGGMLLGYFTATESAAVAVAYAAFVGFFIHRDLKVKDLPKFLLRSSIVTAVVIFLIAISRVVSWILTVQQFPDILAAFLLSITQSPVIFMLIITGMLLVVGCFIDPGAAIIMLAPILAPIALKFGVDPIHFALAMILNLQIGMITPPVGVILFVSSSIAEISFERVVSAIWPFVVGAFIVLFLVVLFPAFSTFIPHAFGY